MLTIDFKRRFCCFLIGTVLLGFGVACSTCAGLGTSPISSVPYVLTFILPLSFGMATFLFNLFFVLGQIAVQRRNYRRLQLVQLPAVFLLGLFIDLGMYCVSGFVTGHYLLQLAELLVGCLLIALGVALQLVSDVSYVPGDGFIKVLCAHFRVEFGTVKLTFDSTLVMLAAVVSLVFLVELVGLREGTVLAALCVGPLVRLLLPQLRFLKKWFIVRRPMLIAGR